MDDNDTLQGLERTTSRIDEFAPIATIPATETDVRAWRRKFDTQFNQQLAVQVLKRTRALIRAAQEMTPWRDLRGADDRLNGAVFKLLSGKRHWDPSVVDLGKFLYEAIRSDISNEIEQQTDRPHRSLDEDDATDIDEMEQTASDQISLERTSKTEVPTQRWWTPLISEMRQLARAEPRVLALLTAYEAGHFDRRAVIKFTGLSPRQHDAAFRRLQQLAQQINEKLRLVVDQAIE